MVLLYPVVLLTWQTIELLNIELLVFYTPYIPW